MKSIYPLILLFALAFVLKAESQPAGSIAPKPLFRDPVHDGAADPVLVWNRGEKKWFMFYTDRRANLRDAPGVSWVHGTRIGIAESADGGTTWKYRGTAEIGYGKPDYTYWAPDVIDHGGKYHMYLSVVPGVFNDWNAPREIVHLTSENLLKWTYESTLPLASDRVIDATVCRLGPGKWRLWYKNERDKSHIYYADSPDLYHWKQGGVAVSDRAGEGAKVFRWQNRYWMITDTWNGLSVYSSVDAEKWTAQAEPILREPGQAPSDRAKGQHADVVVDGDRAFLFYFVHQRGADADPSDPTWQRRTVIQVVELEYKEGRLDCDRNAPTRILLHPPAGAAPQLGLQVGVDQKRYCEGDVETGTLHLECTFAFINRGGRPIILSKSSGPIQKLAIASTGDKSKGPQPPVAALFTNMSIRSPLKDTAGPGPEFVVLQPGEVLRTHALIPVPFQRPEAKRAFESLAPGSYALRVLVATWFDAPELRDRLRDRWKESGYLWAENVLSDTLPVTVDAHPRVRRCK